ncbi:hypothetical protein M3E01_10150, partial [Corynebacterium kefirresidentii]|uniref:hypothetical protein n=1 Tax=Corynebacterium kefirresidentii TaxID=1979527 RepID=UPI00223ACBEE
VTTTSRSKWRIHPLTARIADLVTNAQEAAHAAISNGWDTLEQASLFFRKLPYLIPDALNEFNRNILGF